MPKYIALQSVGAFLPGDEIKGLNEDRIQALLASGAIDEYKAPEQTTSDDLAAAAAKTHKANKTASKGATDPK